MPILDTVVLFGSADTADKQHRKALYHMRRLGDPETWLASFSLVEFDVVLKSRGISYRDRMKRYALMVREFPDVTVKVRRISPAVLYFTASLELQLAMDYFDAAVASEALQYDGIIISTDQVFDKVPGLKRSW